MEQIDPSHREPASAHTLQLRWRIAWILSSIILVILLLGIFRNRIQHLDRSSWLLFAVVAVLCMVIFFHTRFLLDARAQHRESERRFQQMASNIQEIFWMIDAESKRILYVNEAFEAITGRPRAILWNNLRSGEDVVHPEDRPWLLSQVNAATKTGRFDERFRIVLPHGEVRWVWVRGFPVRRPDARIDRLVGTAQDVTAQKQAEEQVVASLAAAECSRAEADALRKATLALTQDLHMDYVLDTLLQCLTELIPCESARVLLVESGTRLFVARDRHQGTNCASDSADPLTLEDAQIPLLESALRNQQTVLLMSSDLSPQERAVLGDAKGAAWLCVPLIASQQVLGLLSLCHVQPDIFTEEHRRRAELLAIPAAVAIQNARLYERAEIYGAELERRARSETKKTHQDS